jgi:hypothetical protein
MGRSGGGARVAGAAVMFQSARVAGRLASPRHRLGDESRALVATSRTEYGSASRPTRSPAQSPDGTRIAFGSGRVRSADSPSSGASSQRLINGGVVKSAQRLVS